MQGEVDEAISMYQELHRWEDAIAVAEARVKKNGNPFKLGVVDILLVPNISRATPT